MTDTPYGDTIVPRERYGDLGTYASGWVCEWAGPRVWITIPKRKARGTIVAVFPKARDVVEIREHDEAGTLTLIRLPNGAPASC